MRFLWKITKMKAVIPHQFLQFCCCIVSTMTVQQRAISQTIGRQMISAQGGVYTIENGLVFRQSIGQLSAVGTTTTPAHTFQQGFQQSFFSLFENKVEKLSFAVTVYPNPFMDYFTVTISNSLEEVATIRIVTLLGQQVYQNQLAPFQNEKTISFGSYPPGTYIIQLVSSSQTITKKIIKI